MPSPALPSDSQPPVPPVDITANPDVVLIGFWEKNRDILMIACLLILAAIVGRGAWQYFSAQKELGVEKDYAEATSPEQLRAFAEAHPDHALAGVAELRVADAAYQAGQNADALAAYDRASAMIKTGILAARAQLGAAVIKIQNGQGAEGVATLQQLANDPKQFSNIRAEATFHLASLAADAGRADETRQLATQLMQIDPSSPWTQRAFALQAQLAAPAAPASAAPAPGAPGAITFPSGK
jgi:predicted negative regulator of RcsB-dependent stress response